MFSVSALESLEVRVVPARVNPYLQNPATDAMTIMWFTQENVAGTLTVNLPGGPQNFTSTPVFAPELAYAPQEVSLLPGGVDPGSPYKHRIRVTGLQPGTTYSYTVHQGAETFVGQFKTIPTPDTAVRFVVYGDPETEPESTGDRVEWRKPFTTTSRLYPVDQTEGYNQNQNIVETRHPDFIAGLGDLADSGGEQRDWDEFWKHLTGAYSDIGASVPYYGIPGNHDDYGGPGDLGGYGDAGSIRARDKFKTYFESPNNGSGISTFEDRYFRVDYGPITFIGLDVGNGLPENSSSDTNWFLGAGPGYPDFNPGSIQYQWLEAQLADAQSKSQFTFIGLHHAPYSVGPHGLPAGSGTGLDTQSGQPVRVLTPLFKQYGVDAVFGGHDEMYQHAVVEGIHFYEIGTAGDELRSPVTGTDGSSGLPTTDPFQVFLPHLDAPEVWNGNQLLSGGKHYGHLEINSFIDTDGYWKTKIESAYAFPLMDVNGNVIGWERRIYSDAVTLVGNAATSPIGDTVGVARESRFLLDANANHTWDTPNGGDLQFQFGAASDLPIVGDWDGNGIDQIAVVRNGTFYFDYNGNGKWDGPAGGDRVRKFGNPTDLPIAGDWDGDGDDEIGVFRGGQWYLDANGNGVWDNIAGGDLRAAFGIAGDIPVAGDWDADGISEVGIFRGGYWYLDLNGNRMYDGPIAGDARSRFGNPSDIPVVGDWNNEGKDKIGVFRQGSFYLDVDASRSWNPTDSLGDVSFRFGNSNDKPLAGTWAAPAPGLTPTAANPDDSGNQQSVGSSSAALILPQAFQFSAADVVFTVSNSTSSPVTLGIYAQSKKDPNANLTQHSQKTVKPGKSKRLRSAIIYDPNDGLYDFILKLLQNDSIVLSKDYLILTDSVPSDPHGDAINPKEQQIDIAILPGNDIRVSVNPRS